MTGFFNPQGFLTAMRQEVTRMHKGWALDSVTLANDVTKHNYEDVSAGPNEGVYVHGLYLDGAGWDRKNNRLCDPMPKVLNVQMPIIHIYAVNSTAPKDSALYTCPCYKKVIYSLAPKVVILTHSLAAKNRSYLYFAIVAENKCGTFKMDSSWCCALVRHQVNPCSYLYIFLYNHVQSSSFQKFLFQFSSLIQIKKVSFNF